MGKIREIRKCRQQLRENALELVINELRLCATLYRVAAREAPVRKRLQCEEMARERLGQSVTWISCVPLTAEQSRRFHKAFRALAACLPIQPLAMIVPIDSVSRSA